MANRQLTRDNNENQDNDFEDGENLEHVHKQTDTMLSREMLTFISQIPVRGVNPCKKVTKKITAR